MTPWYAEGLHFECTGCGAFCTGAPGYVWRNEDEIQALATHFHLPRDTFLKTYFRQVEGRFSLKEDPENFDCVFLKGKTCTVYALRPTQCRTFPWWTRLLRSEAAWEEASQFCEGIRPEAPLVSLRVIQSELSKYETSHDNC